MRYLEHQFSDARGSDAPAFRWSAWACPARVFPPHRVGWGRLKTSPPASRPPSLHQAPSLVCLPATDLPPSHRLHRHDYRANSPLELSLTCTHSRAVCRRSPPYSPHRTPVSPPLYLTILPSPRSRLGLERHLTSTLNPGLGRPASRHLPGRLDRPPACT